MDSFWDLPFTKLPHPRYKDKRIPAYDMIKFSINTHRGCFGGCNFCTIAAHQGKFIQSRSEESICKEAKGLLSLPGFAGNISDLGAPTANMYGMGGKDKTICAVCRRKSCLFPKPCRNLDRSHARVLGLYEKVMSIKGIKHAYIGSGIRYDLFLDEEGFVDDTSYPYLKELILHHTSGRLKVAPEHTEDKVLQYMAKPSFKLFVRLRREFDKITSQAGMKTGISSLSIVPTVMEEDKIPQDWVKELKATPGTARVIPSNYDSRITASIIYENGRIVLKELQPFHQLSDGSTVKMPINFESDGTIRLIEYTPVIYLVLNQDCTVLIDEVERSLHPILIKEIITKLSESETAKGQLVFTTHESCLLDQDILRPDEIWFAQKDQDQATQFYPLSDFNIHKTANIENGYLNGRYGGIPFLSNLKDLHW